MITRSVLLAHMERAVKAGFLKGQAAYTPIRSQFTREMPSDGAFETYADLGTTPWPTEIGGQPASTAKDANTDAQVVGGINEGEPITILGANERAMKVYNKDWSVAIGVSHNAINDNQLGDLDSWARSAGRRFNQHQDYLCVKALNDGDGTNYGYGYDNQEMFCATHADPGAEYTTAQDNEFDHVLTIDTLETVRIAASKFKDDRGQPAVFNHSLLIVPTDLERMAFNLCNNAEDYSQTDRARNPYAGQLRPLVVPGGWMDAAAWFLVCTDVEEKPINLQIRQAPALSVWDDESQGSGIRYFKLFARYEVFYGDWRLAVMGDS